MTGSNDLRGASGSSAPDVHRPIFEAVGERCAFVAPLPWEDSEAGAFTALLARSGMRVERIDPVAELQALIDRPWRSARHLRFPSSERAAQWAYGRKGIRIPGTVLEQLDFGERVPIDRVERGDLIFARSDGGSHLLGLFNGEKSVLGVPRGGRALVTEIPVTLRQVSAHLLARRPIARELQVLTVLSRSPSEIFDSRDIERLVRRFEH